MSTRKTGADLLKKYSVQRLSELKAQTAQKIDEYEKSLDEGKLSAEQEKELDTLMNMEEGIIKEMNKRDMQQQYPGFLAAKGESTEEKKTFYMHGDKKEAEKMWEDSSNSCGFDNLGDFLNAVRNQGDPRLYAKPYNDFKASASTTVPSEGGFFVPTQFSAPLIDTMLSQDTVMSRATVFPVQGKGKVKKPVWFPDDFSSNVGGLTAYWTEENSLPTNSDFELKQVEFTPHKLNILTYVPNELLEDAPGSSGDIEAILQSAIRHYINTNLINGDGAGKPLGLLNSPALESVAKESGQEADTLQYENLAKQYAKVYSKKNAIYLTNDDTAPQLLGLSREVGTGGTAIQVLKESNGRFSIFGKEIVFDQSMPTLGDANDIVCVDLSKYLIGLWRNIEVKVSTHYKFAYDQTTFLVTVRLDGMCAYESAITPEKSSSKLSPIVGLAARA